MNVICIGIENGYTWRILSNNDVYYSPVEGITHSTSPNVTILNTNCSNIPF